MASGTGRRRSVAKGAAKKRAVAGERAERKRAAGTTATRDGRHRTSAKLEKPHAEALLLDPRFKAAPYVGRYGWVEFALEDVTPAELERLVHESYRLVAPKRRRVR